MLETEIANLSLMSQFRALNGFELCKFESGAM
jgi:hypothetical protein